MIRGISPLVFFLAETSVPGFFLYFFAPAERNKIRFQLFLIRFGQKETKIDK